VAAENKSVLNEGILGFDRALLIWQTPLMDFDFNSKKGLSP
jgi:hypothetical protein